MPQLEGMLIKRPLIHVVFAGSLLLFFFPFSFLSLSYSSSSLLVWMELVARFSPSSPTLGLLCESHVCDIGVSI
jgi:hypothetical protein